MNKINTLFFAAMLLSVGSLLAQDSLPKSSEAGKWQFNIAPYLIFPNMSGNTGLAGLPLVEVDANPGDIFDKLQAGAMLYLEATKGKWSITSDLLFMKLKQDAEPGIVIKSGSVEAKQFFWEVAGLRRVTPCLEFGLGGILNSLAMDVAFSRAEAGGGTVSQSGSKSKTWFDPMVISRLSTPSGKKFIGQLRAEFGGFGIGSDLTWHLQAYAGYRFSKLFDMAAGYKAVSMDYASGEGAKTFIYDMTTFGPILRFGFSF